MTHYCEHIDPSDHTVKDARPACPFCGWVGCWSKCPMSLACNDCVQHTVNVPCNACIVNLATPRLHECAGCKYPVCEIHCVFYNGHYFCAHPYYSCLTPEHIAAYGVFYNGTPKGY